MSDIIRRWAQQSLTNKITKFLEGASEDLMLRIIAADAESSYDHAMKEKRDKFGWLPGRPFRWEPGEAAISKDADYSYRYARDLIEGRWEPGEEIISKDANYSYEYALHIVKGRWEPGEKAISGDAHYSMKYAELLGHRFVLGEESISKSGADALKYARSIVRGRWEAGEEAIGESPELMYLYAKDVFKGRLPDALHNKMVMLSYSDQADEFVTKYCKAKKYMIKSRKRAS